MPISHGAALTLKRQPNHFTCLALGLTCHVNLCAETIYTVGAVDRYNNGVRCNDLHVTIAHSHCLTTFKDTLTVQLGFRLMHCELENMKQNHISQIRLFTIQYLFYVLVERAPCGHISDWWRLLSHLFPNPWRHLDKRWFRFRFATQIYNVALSEHADFPELWMK